MNQGSTMTGKKMLRRSANIYLACMYNVINVLKHMPQRNGNRKSYI